MSRPWLSVLMPVLNGENYIAQALESVAIQSEGVECIVVDGGSDDATLQVVNSFPDRMTIRLYHFPKNSTWVAKTNFALREALGDFVSILPHDDLWLPARAAELKQLTISQHADLILHAAKFVDKNGRSLGRWSCPLPANQELNKQLLLERLLVQNFVAAPAMLVRRQTALDVGGFDESLWYTADWDFHLKVAAFGLTRYLDKELSAFRLHGSSLTISGSRDAEDFMRQMTAVLDRHIDSLTAPRSRSSVSRASHLSAAINTALATAYRGEKGSLLRCLLTILRNPPAVWYRYLQSSRIGQRTMARLRARF